MLKGAQPTNYILTSPRSRRSVDAAVIEEVEICLFVNGHELTAFMCSPLDLEAMALGFLRAEGFIQSMQDVDLIEQSRSGNCIDIWLSKGINMPARVIRTSGCGGGVTFDDLNAQRAPLPPGPGLSSQQVIDRYFELRARESLYPVTRGVHASALCSPDSVIMIAEDVGRHNTLDKLAGKAMLAGIDTSGALIVTTGRISSEMLGKAAKMGAPIVASRTSPTSRSLALAQAWNMTVVGYVRQRSMRIYTNPDRIRQP